MKITANRNPNSKLLSWNSPCPNTFISGEDMVGVIKIISSDREPMVDSALGNYRLFTCRDCWRGSRCAGTIPGNPITDSLYEMRMKQFRGIGKDSGEQDEEKQDGEKKDEATPHREQRELQPVAGPSKTQAEKRLEQESNVTPTTTSKKAKTSSKPRKELFKDEESADNID